jgi:hypothetical protein
MSAPPGALSPLVPRRFNLLGGFAQTIRIGHKMVRFRLLMTKKSLQKPTFCAKPPEGEGTQEQQ